MARTVDREILLGFIEEARGYLPRLLNDLGDYQSDPGQLDALEEAHRLFHTIKGAAAMVGIAGLSHIAYFGEEACEELASGQLLPGDETFTVLRKTVTCIELYLNGFTKGKLDERSLLAEITYAYRRLRGLPDAEDAAALETALAGIEKAPAFPAEAPAPGVDSAPPAQPVAGLTQTPVAIETTLPEDVSPELLEVFTLEAEDHMRTLGTLIAGLAQQPDQAAWLKEMRRVVHTLKGTSGMVGYRAVTQLTHRMEDLLDVLREGNGPVPADMQEVLFASADILEDLLAGKADEGSLRALYARYEALLGSSASPLTSGAVELKPARKLAPLGAEKVIDLSELTPVIPEGQEDEGDGSTPGLKLTSPAASKATQVVRVPLERLDEMVRLVSELAISRTAFEQQMLDFIRMTQDLRISSERLRRISATIDTQYETVAMSAWGGGREKTAEVLPGEVWRQGTPGFDALEMDRYTEFHRLTRELAETSNDIKATGNELHTLIGDFDTILNRQGRLSGEIQDKLMRTRMVPLATLATRLHRTVRVLAQAQSKLVDLVLEGENIELDKTMLEEMADPLMHLLRNAVDHGIEPPALRQVIGKPERGLIRLRAYYEGNQIIIQISDDGAGLEPEILRASAVSGGYVSEADAPNLPPEELYALIFLPGFSTSSQVSEVSGRGIGMDVVKTSVHKLKGTITLDSTPGKGITFTIRLPMTLAITRALLVQANGETFAIPLGAITQILRMGQEDFERVGNEPVVRVGKKVYPLLRLADVLHLKQTDEETRKSLPVLIINAGSKQIALRVDRLLQQRDIVIKTLGSHLRQVRGVTGATLMGDGSVVLILNPAELTGESSTGTGRTWNAPNRPVTRSEALNVMIVDDSPSVRRVISNLVKNAGWQPTTAKDGLDALQIIQQGATLPDLILLDIEMPRMDGYELTATLKAQEAYRAIPIVMLTSRAGEKHRQKAFEVGVSEYMVKPYQDELLLETIRHLAGHARKPATA
jgi:chemosensory pili system protein ChpA (sensor histidine kinase/response regulator)